MQVWASADHMQLMSAEKKATLSLYVPMLDRLALLQKHSLEFKLNIYNNKEIQETFSCFIYQQRSIMLQKNIPATPSDADISTHWRKFGKSNPFIVENIYK